MISAKNKKNETFVSKYIQNIDSVAQKKVKVNKTTFDKQGGQDEFSKRFPLGRCDCSKSG